MFKKIRTSTILIGGGFFLCLDQILKYLSLNVFTHKFIILDFLGWKPFFNSGIAFGIPVPSFISIIFTIPILILIAYVLAKNTQKKANFLALTLILAGGLSNLFDRIIYKYTIDYFQIFTSIINLADVMIVTGFGLYLYFNFKTDKNENKNKNNS